MAVLPRCGSKCLGKMGGSQATDQPASQKSLPSPRLGFTSWPARASAVAWGAVALAREADPAPSSSKRPSSSSAQPPLRDLLADYFLTNTLSAQRLHILASSSAVSGAQCLEDLVAAGAHGSAPQNLAREEIFQKSMNNIIPLGLHGDGVPFAAKTRDSLEQLSWSLAADPAAPRILFTAISQ